MQQMKQQGFTLIELIVVMVILGILAAIAMPKFVDLTKEARTAVVQSTSGSLQSAAALVYAKAVTSGQGGTTGQVCLGAYTPGTAAGPGGTPAATQPACSVPFIDTAYGFPKDMDELLKSTDGLWDEDTSALKADSQWELDGTTLQFKSAPTPSDCSITLTFPSAAGETVQATNKISGC
ncbi:MAG: prepilin-type N-terminal cleavage/methylation domain-containing protein [Zoogloeaceae bacterium]|jgi:MSHA pilin protein MshA|nr:prepilin-type N-terminal cleavage/methylation domain-containing protein [Zoogloeaceae bacterium]